MMIFKATFEDLNSLVFIEEELFKNDSSALSRRAFSYHLNKNIIYKLEVDEKVVAYILWLKRKNFYRLYSLAILNDYQGKGLANALLKFSLDVLDKKNFELEVRVSNEKAINLYEKFGFEKIKILKDFYDDEDGIKMRLKR